MRISRGVTIRKFGKVIAGILLVGAGLGLFLLLGNRLFTLRTIEVVGEGMQISVDETKLVKNLLFFPTEQLAQDLLVEYPLLESVEIRKKFPGTLIVIAYPRQPVAAIQSEGTVYLLTADATVLGFAGGSEAVPRGRFSLRPYVPGETLSEEDARAFVFFLAAFEERAKITSGQRHDAASIAMRFENITLYVSNNGDMALKASTLQTLLGGFRIKGTLPAVIDLRFDKPIVTF